MMSNQIIEDFLDHAVSSGATTFNVAAAESWINGNYSRSGGGSWERWEVSQMMQRYCHSQRNLSSTRSGVFKPKYVIDTDRRGGPNAIWTIHQSVADAHTSLIRTADDLASHAANRLLQRINPTYAKDPAAQAAIKPIVKAMSANLEAIASIVRPTP